ncbi:MAG: hypothetical protein K2F90_06325 [Clostridiales bacterium]|nr:hypothetical protein [Clostridiales bacterium]
MAKKVAVPDESEIERNGGVKKKKKRNCCCTCCLVVIIIMLVLFLGAFITGWILGDKYTKKLFGLSMGDTLGVVGDLYWTDDSDVVTRPYTKKDLNGFYNEIKRNIFLKDDTEIDFQSALDAAIDKFLNDDGNGNAGDAAPQLNASAAAAGGADGNQNNTNESDITDIFVNMIVGVLNREHIDVERLNRYPDKDEYIFELNDKQLAAFVNTVLQSVLKKAVDMDSLKDISAMVRLDKVVGLKQIRFTAKSVKAAGGATEVKAASAEITVWLGLQSAANQAIKKFLYDAKQGWAGGLVGWLGDVILPENLYLTVSVPLYGEDNVASIRINDMNSNERARANKLINGIIKLMNDGKESKTLDDVIDDFVGRIRPMLELAAEHMNFSEAGKGTIRVDLLEAVAKVASDSLPEGESLTKADFLYVLQALFSDKAEQLKSLEPFRYDNWYEVDGEIKYMPTGGSAENKVDYERLFIEQIEDKYALDLGESKNLNEVLEMLGISLDGNGGNMGSTDLLDRVNGTRFNALLNANINDIKLNVTDRMLGAAFSGQMDKLLAGNENLKNMDLTLDALTFVKKSDPQKANHLYALLAVEVDVSGMLGEMTSDDETIGKLVKGLMPESILLTVTVDITRDQSVTRDQAEFVINSCQNTDRVLDVLEKLVPDIKLCEVSDSISTTLNEMLDQMESKLAIRLAATTYEYNDDLNKWVGASGAIILPDIFTVVTDMVLVDERGNKIVTSEQLQHVIRDLNNPADIAEVKPTGYGDFIADVFDKYYLTDPTKLSEPQPAVTDFKGLTAYMQDFKVEKLRVQGKDGLAHDDRAMSALRPVMSENEVLALLKDNMGGKDAIQSYNIVKVDIGDDALSVTLSVELSSLLTDAQQVQKLITATELYATATFHTDRVIGDGTADNPYGYQVSLAIDVQRQGENTVMDSDTYGAMLNIVKFFAADFDIESQVKEFGVILYEQMNNLNESIGGSAEHKLFTFTSSGLELTDFYTFLALKMEPDLIEDGYTNEDLRTTLQGLYGYDETAPNNRNFVVENITFNPPSEKGSRRWTDDEITGDRTTGAGGLYGNTHADVDFNGFLKQGVETMASNGEVTVEQTMVLAKGDARDDVAEVRTWLNARLKLDDGESVSVSYDYLAVTFSMTMGRFVGGDGKGTNDATALFPTKIYATVVYKYDSTAVTDKFTVVGGISDVAPVLVFNDMESTQYEIMVRFMGANPADADTGASDDSKVNIKSIAKQGAEVLNGMTHMEYEYGGMSGTLDTTIIFSATAANESGMGKIYISKPVPSFGS